MPCPFVGARSALVATAVLLSAGLMTAPSLAQPSDGAPGDDDAPSGEVGADEAGDGEDLPEDEPVEATTVDDDAVLRYPPSSVRLPLILGGAGVFGVAYGLTAMSSRLWPTVPGADHMLIPVAGPWVALAQSGCAPEDTDGCTVPLVFRTILLVLDGLAQAGGVMLVGEGLFMTTEAAGPDAPQKAQQQAQWHLVPDVGPTHTGIGVVGTF